MSQIDVTVENLNKRRFHATRFPTLSQAKEAILDLIGARSVGIGGSHTISESGLYEALKERGNTVYCHTYVPVEEKKAVRKAAMNADVYLCSANAVTQNGVIVNIDGTGNRVAATIFGPETVILLVGRNKLVATVEEGIQRTKRECCPKNARRLGLKTPCAATGICGDCSSPARMCNVTVLHEYPTRYSQDFYVFVVDEDLGW